MEPRKSAIGEQIRLDAGIRARLERLSTLMNVPLLTLVSHAIEKWLAQQERTLALIESLGDAVDAEMRSHFKSMLRTGLFARQQGLAGGPELTEAQIGVIAEQEDLSTAAAAGLGDALLQSGEGLREIERLIRENIKNARTQGESEKAEAIEQALAQFKERYPLSPAAAAG